MEKKLEPFIQSIAKGGKCLVCRYLPRKRHGTLGRQTKRVSSVVSVPQW